MAVNILVVDDEEIIRAIWQEIFFENDQFSISVACDGKDAISKIKKKSYDIVVTDLNMPGINGLELTEKIKKINPETEIIIMTAYGTVEYAVSAMKKGAYDFILKPLDFDRVRLVLSNCCRQIEYKRENKDLKELNLKLKELNEVREKFITITNHELRTPTNAISGLIELLYERMPKETTEAFSKEFDILLAASNNLKDIVEDMHDLSIASSSGLKLHTFPFEINQLANEIRFSFKLYSKDREIGFNIINKLDGEHYIGDLRRIKQGVGELIQNAVKFTKDGGNIDVTFDKRKEGETDYFVIGVSDNGIGIEDNQLDKIFDAFYEVQETSRHHSSQTEFMGGGIGIGLSIVKEIAESHDGRLTVVSEPGKGSSFEIYLPYKKA